MKKDSVASRLSNIFDWVMKFIALVSLLLGVYLFFSNRARDSKIDKINYNQMAISNKPQLYIVGNPVIISVLPILDPSSALRNVKPTLGGQPVLSDSFFLSTFSINTKVSFVNSGDYIASVRGYCLCDTLSGDEVALKSLLENKVIILPITEYYQVKQIKPLVDTFNLNLVDTLRFISNDSLTLHYLLLYEGVKGTLYYSYFWARYCLKPFLPVNTLVSTAPGKIILDYRMSKKDLREMFILIDHASSWNYLSEDKVKKIEEIFNKAHN